MSNLFNFESEFDNFDEAIPGGSGNIDPGGTSRPTGAANDDDDDDDDDDSGDKPKGGSGGIDPGGTG